MPFNISWIFTAASLLGNVFVIKKQIKGQVIWAISNIGWSIYFLKLGEYPSAALFFIYLLLCVYGIISWTNEAKKGKYSWPKWRKELNKAPKDAIRVVKNGKATKD